LSLAAQTMTATDARRAFDVAIAGAGLPGLALAVAAADAGLATLLIDREAIAAPPADDDGFDTRIYAVSPGSAAFLARLGAWAELASERLTPVESMRVTGDLGSVLDFSAHELDERALRGSRCWHRRHSRRSPSASTARR
jgi:2-polyprenyl-6-methoxyphenol hydroxylase-like FAD-dependent oxidoreductase